ncbi:serine/threonine-protein kinase [Stieleria sp. ICT_E10.1]|uniref:WD40 repeat domain-containing serine/threonine protein kinase n=1 Tax=Stieleria sedimenti TaxID=2976331 RepID=UPI00217F26B5|nr:serine/threonine-protein kinase [Stieleria sedimenti]MCS7469598.1 serine/threonine-protein kinase [Stieleria sedimenti]
MADSPDGHVEAFDRIVHEYYQAVENGQRVDAKVFIDQHPEFKDDLESFFADLEILGDYANKRTMSGTLADTPTNLEPRVVTVGPGTSLKYIGEYRILEEIARGGMGVVFKAKQEKLRRTVALKMILSGRLAGAAEVDRFQREARAAASIKHPNIVGVHEIGVHEGQHYFTMDYVESESLRERLREGSLAPQKAAKLTETLARATQFAHTRGILHRDLKPANVLVDSNEQPYITDFGLAKPLADFDDASQTDITRSGQIIGTPSYMSPEQAAAKHQLVGVASDIYSLGAILYACLSGRAPFVAESSVETIRQVIHDEPVPPTVLNPRVPRDLETICLKCLEKEPHKRYGTAALLADDVTRYLADEPILARRVTSIERIWRWCRREPRMAVLCMVLSLVVLLIATIGPIIAAQQIRLRGEAEYLLGEKTQLLDEKAGLVNQLQDSVKEQERFAEKLQDRNIGLSRQTAFLYLARGSNLYDQGFYRSSSIEFLRAFTVLPTSDPLSDSIRSVALARLTHGGRCQSIIPHGSGVGPVAFSRDGSRIMTASGRFIRMSDTRTGLPIGPVIEYEEPFRDSPFAKSPDGSRIVVTALSMRKSDKAKSRYLGRARILDTASGRQIGASLTHDNRIEAVTFSSDGKFVITGSHDNTARIWSATTGEPIGQPIQHEAVVVSVDISPNGHFVATGSSNNLIRISDNRGRPVGEPLKHDDVEYQIGDPNLGESRVGGVVTSLAFGPDGSQLLSAATSGIVRWDVKTGRRIDKLKRKYKFTIDPSRKRFFTYSELGVDAWDFHTLRLRGHVASPAEKLEFSANGKRFVTIFGTSARVHNALTLEQIGAPLPHEHRVRSVAFSPTADRVASGSEDPTVAGGSKEDEVRVWRVEAPTRVLLNGVYGQVAAINSDRTRLITTEENLSPATDGMGYVAKLWDVEYERVLGETSVHTGEITCVAFSADGQQFVTASGNTARVWGSDIIQEARKITCEGEIKSVFFAGNRNWATIAWNQERGYRREDLPDRLLFARDLRIQVWDMDEVRPVGPTIEFLGSSIAVAISPDGRMVASGSNGQVQLWDSRSGEPLGDPLGEKVVAGSRTGKVQVAFSPNGSQLIAGNHTLRIWDLTSRQPIGQHMPHDGTVTSIAYDQEGFRVATGTYEGWEGKARVWDARTGQPLTNPIEFKESALDKVALTKDDKLVTWTMDECGLWDIGTNIRSEDFRTWFERVLKVTVGGDGSVNINRAPRP